MSSNSIHDLVYSKNVVEFVTVANEYCRMIERVSAAEPDHLLSTAQKLLPLVYLKASLLPKAEKCLDDEIEKYLNEYEYNILLQKWLSKLGESDDFQEVFDPEIQSGLEPVKASISENLLDIYQDLKEFISSYQFGNEEIMNDALADCVYNFETFWGQRLVNVLRALHALIYADKNPELPKPAARKTRNRKDGWVEGFFNEFGG
jgi:hypothetical protein